MLNHFSDRMDKQVLLIAGARFVSSITSGFTLFCAPAYFIGTAGLSGSLVGAGLGAGGISSILGRVLGGIISDGKRFGKKAIIITSIIFMVVGSALMSSAAEFAVFVAGTLLIGFGFGLFSPAADALIAEVTPQDSLSEAYAYNRLANWIGLGFGLVAGALLVKLTGAYLGLFAICTLLFAITLLMACLTIERKERNQPSRDRMLANKLTEAFSDSRLRLYLLLNVGLANNVLMVMSVVPLYLLNCLRSQYQVSNIDLGVASLFLVFIVACALFQMPISRFLKGVSQARVLLGASIAWALAFVALWMSGSGLAGTLPLIATIILLLALASASYGPAASAYTVSIAPQECRALYLSVNSLCWGIARLFGPALGLMMIDSSLPSAAQFWLALSVVNLAILAPGLLLLEKRSREVHPALIARAH